jgi:putative ABC transport system permease protein
MTVRVADLLALARDNLNRAKLRTALTAIGVTIGTAAVVMLLAAGNGAEAITVGQINQFGSVTMVQVLPATVATRRTPPRSHALRPATVRAIAALPHVTGVDTFMQTPPLRLTVQGRSLDLATSGQSPLDSGLTLVAGSGGRPGDPALVLVPASAAAALHVPAAALVGRHVVLTAGGDVAAASASKGEGGNPNIFVVGPDRHFAARVAGVYDDSNAPAGLVVSSALAASIDARLSGMPAAAYLDKQGYQLLLVHTDDARQTQPVADKIAALDYATRDRADLLARVQTAYTILKGLLGAVGGIALLVAGVGIANTMIMTILERTREIGIMKALGAEPGTVRRLFLAETSLIGLLGGVAGLALAVVVAAIGNIAFKRWLETQGATGVTGALFVIPPLLAIGAIALAVAISLVAGLWPSRRAVRLQPLEALRYESRAGHAWPARGRRGVFRHRSFIPHSLAPCYARAMKRHAPAPYHAGPSLARSPARRLGRLAADLLRVSGARGAPAGGRLQSGPPAPAALGAGVPLLHVAAWPHALRLDAELLAVGLLLVVAGVRGLRHSRRQGR